MGASEFFDEVLDMDEKDWKNYIQTNIHTLGGGSQTKDDSKYETDTMFNLNADSNTIIIKDTEMNTEHQSCNLNNQSRWKKASQKWDGEWDTLSPTIPKITCSVENSCKNKITRKETGNFAASFDKLNELECNDTKLAENDKSAEFSRVLINNKVTKYNQLFESQTECNSFNNAILATSELCELKGRGYMTSQMDKFKYQTSKILEDAELELQESDGLDHVPGAPNNTFVVHNQTNNTVSYSPSPNNRTPMSFLPKDDHNSPVLDQQNQKTFISEDDERKNSDNSNKNGDYTENDITLDLFRNKETNAPHNTFIQYNDKHDDTVDNLNIENQLKSMEKFPNNFVPKTPDPTSTILEDSPSRPNRLRQCHTIYETNSDQLIKTGEFFLAENRLSPTKDDVYSCEKIYKPGEHETWKHYKGNFKDNKFHGQGVMIYKDGAIYSGNWENGQMCGKYGSIKYKAGIIQKYSGGWKDDLYEGDGEMVYLNGNVYKGDFEKGFKCGKGVMTYVNGDIYKGLWKDGQRHGDGMLTYSNHESYKGSWVNDKCEGYGEYIYRDGNHFRGNFKNNMKNGDGQLNLTNGDLLKGVWFDDVLDESQKIKYFYKNKNQYIGYFKNGFKQGEGVMLYGNGDIYEGQWDADLRSNGEQTFANGDFYIGKFVEDLFSGQAVIYYSDKTRKFDGIFVEGLKHGYGKFYWKNGYTSYEGEWLENQKSGNGKYYYENGNLWYEGRSKNGLPEGNGAAYDEFGHLRYSGNFTKGLQNGKGKEYESNQNIYSGYWKDGVRSGLGTETNIDGIVIYIGNFSEGERNGHGIEYEGNSGYKNYEGEFRNDSKHGKGQKFYPDGVIWYCGDFEDDYQIGFGKYYDRKGTQLYKGQHKNGKAEGKGIYHHQNGKIWFEGDYKNGKPDGEGVEYNENGVLIFQGQCKNGKPDGKGKGYDENGVMNYEGEWKNGLSDGKGKGYDSDGNLIWEGQFKNGKYISKGIGVFK